MTKLLSQHFRCTALGIYLWLYSCSLIAWPKLSCVYCTGKASGWFFRHEMSDLFVNLILTVVPKQAINSVTICPLASAYIGQMYCIPSLVPSDYIIFVVQMLSQVTVFA